MLRNCDFYFSINNLYLIFAIGDKGEKNDF